MAGIQFGLVEKSNTQAIYLAALEIIGNNDIPMGEQSPDHDLKGCRTQPHRLPTWPWHLAVNQITPQGVAVLEEFGWAFARELLITEPRSQGLTSLSDRLFTKAPQGADERVSLPDRKICALGLVDEMIHKSNFSV